ncbi:unnamed protein product [Urochloa humidicola]
MGPGRRAEEAAVVDRAENAGRRRRSPWMGARNAGRRRQPLGTGQRRRPLGMEPERRVEEAAAEDGAGTPSSSGRRRLQLPSAVGDDELMSR